MGEVSDAVEAIRSQLEVLHRACEAVSHRELVGLLAEVTTIARSIPALEHRAVSRLVAETEPARLGEASWPKVLTTALRVSSKDAKHRLREAAVLGPRRSLTGQPLAPVWEATAAAQARGLIGAEHVEIIARFHKLLPSWVDVGTRVDAEAQLAGKAAGLGPEALDEAAGALLMMIDQDGPEPSEKEQARTRGIVLGKQQRDGTRSIRGRLDAEAGSYWEAILAKEAAPGANIPDDEPGDGQAEGEPGADGEAGEPRAGSDTRTQAQRNHDAFKAVGRAALASGNLGTHNGLPVTVIVSTTLQDLEKGAGLAVTGGGSKLAIPTLIRMAARGAYHYLYIYDTHTRESLYLGRTKRLASAAQRIVLHARERGCTRPGCTVCGYNSQVHHAVADWKNDGQTNIDDLTFACGPDNRLIEKTGWTTRKNSHGDTEWIPPPDLDTGQTRINNYHHPERYLLPDDDSSDDDTPEDGDSPGGDSVKGERGP
ncbi:HNH endonuclease signature motif containing protein [Mycolicibacterium hippocampi]|uniref:13E12 repeat family protein n=1 Tax=Mycolicibacterium hippocampi TaxID=659824 RepID=A0A850PP64_9MYCO|nr:HNH endonuclease signature motif containing protein [Mycolicibacterium hippocampi]NVN52438.1 13E12 repeat family protein [Mycolicibacterium hippocampi]